MTTLNGQRLGHYEILDKIGQGGMATVYRAASPTGIVAVKALHPLLRDVPDFNAAFSQEAQTLALLHHPHIVPLYDYRLAPPQPYLVTAYIRGPTLADLEKHYYPANQLLRYLIQMAHALAYVHRQGFVHQDVKPANILIDGDQALLCDFGSVLNYRTPTPLNNPSLGSPIYIAPEQIRGQPVDPRTDIYALGVILYRLLTGSLLRPPVRAIHIPKLRPGFPTAEAERLLAVALRAVATNPAERYGCMAELIEAVGAG